MRRPTFVASAPAKVNLGLEVVGRRDDGYHAVVTVMQAISLYDTFEWRPSDAGFAYVGPPGVTPSADIALRALRSAPDFASWSGTLRLRKRISLSAGLGGGSSDAALALRIALPDATDAELRTTAADIGSDVPFFVAGGAALATGTGATLDALPPAIGWVVIVTPPLSLADKTRALYGGLRPADFSSGDNVRATAALLRLGQPISGPLVNTFERQLYTQPVVRYAHTSLLRAGAPFVALSGAGPSLFTLLRAYRDAARVMRQLPADVGEIALARTVAGSNSLPARRIAQALRGRMKM